MSTSASKASSAGKAPLVVKAHLVLDPPPGVNWDDISQVRGNVLRDFNTTVSYRQRDQWGPEKIVSAFGPPAKLEAAVESARSQLEQLQSKAAPAASLPLQPASVWANSPIVSDSETPRLVRPPQRQQQPQQQHQWQVSPRISAYLPRVLLCVSPTYLPRISRVSPTYLPRISQEAYIAYLQRISRVSPTSFPEFLAGLIS